MKKLTVKKMSSLVLMAALTLSLAACGRGGDEQQGQGGSAGTPEWVYVPEFLELEGAENISWYDTKISGDNLYYTSYSWDEETMIYTTALCKYSITDGTTEEIPLTLPEDANLNKWSIGVDGSIFGILYTWSMDDSGNYNDSRSLAKFDAQGNEVYCMNIDDLFAEEYSYISDLTADGQGRVYIVGDSQIWLFDQEGNKAGEVNMSAGRSSYVNNCGRGMDGKVYVCVTIYGDADRSTALSEVLFDTKSLGEGYENIPSGNGGLVQTEEGKFLVNNGSSVSEYDPETQEKQDLFSWLDSDINGSNVRSFGCLSDGRMIAVYEDWESGDSGVALLTKTSSDQVVQKKQIVIATLYGDNPDMQAAAVNFNKSSDEYHVTIRGYMNTDSWSETAYEDAMTRLNNDITSKNCPDIIDLSYVDASQLAAKGVFEDLSPYLDQSSKLSRSGLIENILNAYTYDNVLVSIPDSFQLETVIGSAAQVGEEMGWTLEEMIAFADEHPNAELFDRVSKTTIMSYCLMYNMDTFVDWSTGTCRFDSDEFKKLLEFVNRFPNPDDIVWDEFQASEPTRIQRGEVLLSNAYISDLDDMQLYIEMFQGPVTCIGYPNTDGSSGCILSGQGAYAITAKSNNKDGAWAFIENYLTRDNVRWRWGFPVLQKELDEMAEEAVRVEYWTDENGEYILDENGEPMTIGGGHGVGYQDGWEYMYRIPTQEEVDIILDLINVAKPTSNTNQQIMNFINEEAEAFFQGQKTVDEVTIIIQNIVNTYVSENS